MHVALLAYLEAFEHNIAGLAARRLGGQAEDEVSSLIAAVVIAVIREGMHRWALGPGDDKSPVPYVERSVRLLPTLFAS